MWNHKYRLDSVYDFLVIIDYLLEQKSHLAVDKVVAQLSLDVEPKIERSQNKQPLFLLKLD